jgi:hypothetical protein
MLGTPRSVRIYRTTRSCTLQIKGYETYLMEAAFEEWDTRYSL